MKREELMKVIVEAPSFVKSLLLTENAAELVRIVKIKRSITAPELSELREISIQNSSAQLRFLYKTGYLKRTETSQKMGGIQYLYKSNI
jgi:predicted transcriptional regulator